MTSLAGAFPELRIAAAHAGQVYFSNMLVIFGLGTLGVSFFAIAVLASDRDRGLAMTAAVIGWFGAFCGAVVNVLIGFNLAAAAAARSPSAAAQILVSGNTAAVAKVFFTGYFAGIPVATILTGIALWLGSPAAASTCATRVPARTRSSGPVIERARAALPPRLQTAGKGIVPAGALIRGVSSAGSRSC